MSAWRGRAGEWFPGTMRRLCTTGRRHNSTRRHLPRVWEPRRGQPLRAGAWLGLCGGRRGATPLMSRAGWPRHEGERRTHAQAAGRVLMEPCKTQSK